MITNKIKSVTLFVTYFSITIAIFSSKPPATEDLHPVLLKSIILGTDQGYMAFGHEFESFAKGLAGHEKISFISDYPYHAYGESADELYKAQSYFIPKLVNTAPDELLAIVYCSSDEIARQRMSEEGYQPRIEIKPGQFIATKEPGSS